MILFILIETYMFKQKFKLTSDLTINDIFRIENLHHCYIIGENFNS